MTENPNHERVEHNQTRHRPVMRRDSNVSNASFYSDVEMAQNEVFSGPVPESLPSSISSFAHRGRSRAGSTASFTFFHPMHTDHQTWQDERLENALVDDSDADEFGYDPSGILEEQTEPDEAHEHHRRRSSHILRDSVRDPLIERRDSIKSDTALREPRRTSQKLYIETEDLTIVIAGFTTSRFGTAMAYGLTALTCGVSFLVLRWFPRLRVWLIGKPSSLQNCHWVVVENQWNELTVLDVEKLRYGQPLSTVFGESGKPSLSDLDEDSDPSLQSLRYLDYRYIRFCYHPVLDKFVLNNSWKDPNWTNVRKISTGIDGEDKEYRSMAFGRNVIDIQEKPIMQLLIDEVFHPFYVFQIASLILWSVDEYYYYAICIFIISAVSIVGTLVETRATMKRLREVSRFICRVRVQRSGFWSYISSEDLVPGDVYEITDPSLTQFPCDSILLSGDCIVNESMLTGESIPVSKSPCTNEALGLLDLSASSILPDVAKHVLFAGTKIVRARKPQDTGAVGLAMAIRTGFNTTKGALVRSMLFPKPSGFKFYRDSFYYIGVMGIIAAIGFLASLVNFIHLGLPWHLIFVRALDLITIVVPPALPATLTIGTNFALSRLKRNRIFCISPQRVNVGGKLDVICFDKTGTLTEDGLDVLGIRAVDTSVNQFTKLLTDIKLVDTTEIHNITTWKSVLHTMTTCHSLKLVNDELVGDPLDQKMFGFTGWVFSEGDTLADANSGVRHSNLSSCTVRPPNTMEGLANNGGLLHDNLEPAPTELGIIKSFEFVSHLRRTSVIVRQFKAQDAHVYVKGAPECMPDICQPDTFPGDYKELLASYTHGGYRVIACATKRIPKLTWAKAQKMNRTEVESNLTFAGFIIFENKLKPETADALLELRNAEIRQIMCTGDNILTAISVGKECGMISHTSHVFVPHFSQGHMHSPDAKLHWESVKNPAYTLDKDTLLPVGIPVDGNPYEISNLKDYSLAVSGDVFRWVVDYAPTAVLHSMLMRGTVFARMSPDEKHELVEKLQSIDYTVGFCGDGANDCGALKAADVGISLSEAEASVAAPFTSRNFNISCVPRIIREGRASLVTSFSCFKYMSLYSAIQFTTVSILYRKASNLGDFQFLFIDLFLILPIAVFMGWSGAYPKLCVKRPTASLVSRKVLTPLLGQIVIAAALQFLVLAAVQKQPWYIAPTVNKEKVDVRNSENTSLFTVSCYQYIFSAVILTVGPPYRKPMLQNIPFVITILATVIITSYILFAPSHETYVFMQLTRMTVDFKAFIFLTAVVGFIIAYVAEKRFFPRLSKAMGSAREYLRKGAKAKKKYKVLDKSMMF